jgi:tetrahydromethanopterin S-methyltransferase subunit G
MALDFTPVLASGCAGFQPGRSRQMAERRDKDDEAESRRIIERVTQESEPGGVVRRTAQRLEDHLSAADAEPDDRIEKWGTRIGRGIGLLLTIGLILWFLSYLVG